MYIENRLRDSIANGHFCTQSFIVNFYATVLSITIVLINLNPSLNALKSSESSDRFYFCNVTCAQHKCISYEGIEIKLV